MMLKSKKLIKKAVSHVRVGLWPSRLWRVSVDFLFTILQLVGAEAIGGKLAPLHFRGRLTAFQNVCVIDILTNTLSGHVATYLDADFRNEGK